MKKFAAILLCLSMCFSVAACADNSVQPQGGDTEGEYRLTQESSVKREKYLDVKEYREFLSAAEKSFLIPGLNQAVIPQGMDYCAANGLIYISGYFKTDSVPSVLMAVNAETGEFAAEYRLYNSDGSPFASHVGGVAVCDDCIFVSAKLDSDGEYSAAVIPLAELPESGSHDITVNKTVKLSVSPSFMNCSQGYLWVGNFYHPSANYGLSAGVNYTTATADGDYGCYILGYDISEESFPECTVPAIVLIAPDRIQGMTMVDANTVVLSQSYGRKNDSTLFFYSADLSSPDTEITVNGKSVPAVTLAGGALERKITAMPMTEALCLDQNGKLLVLFESGAMAYSDGKNRTDYVWTFTGN